MIVLRQSAGWWRNLALNYLSAITHFRSIQTVRLIKHRMENVIGGNASLFIYYFTICIYIFDSPFCTQHTM